MYAQKRIVSVTLDIECYEDLDLKDINWNDILGLEGDEKVDISIRETCRRVLVCQFPDWHERALKKCLVRPIERPYECDSRGSGTRFRHRAPKSCIVVKGHQKFTSKMINNDTLEMLSAREQLIEDDMNQLLNFQAHFAGICGRVSILKLKRI